VAPFFALAISLTTPAVSWADDVVVLKDGGRLRGTVIEESRGRGVRIRLLDGVVREVEPANVDRVQYDSAMSTASGRLVIESVTPGTVFVDEKERGPSPVDLPSISNGRHSIHIEFADGGSSTKTAYVMANQTTVVAMDVTGLVSTYRRGPRFGVAAEGAEFAFGTGSHGVTTGGARLLPFLNLGVSRLVDVRIAASLMVSGVASAVQNDLVWSAGGDLAVRLNVLSFYAVGMGAYVGYLAWPRPELIGQPTATSALLGMVEGSPALFRFGEKRQFEAGLMFGAGMLSLDNSSAFFASAGFGYLFL